jgi:hypothetical protein
MRLQERAPVVGFDRNLERLQRPGGDRRRERIREQKGAAPFPVAPRISGICVLAGLSP